jgi:micrococcal nuclease
MLVNFLFIFIFSLLSSEDFHDIKYLYNYDGDTIFFDISKQADIFGKKISVRLANIDTPELKSKNLCEKQKAIEVKDHVASLLSSAKKIVLKDCKRGKYFRIICRVMFDNKDLSSYLLEKNMAIFYDGKTKKQHDWCKKRVFK